MRHASETQGGVDGVAIRFMTFAADGAVRLQDFLESMTTEKVFEPRSAAEPRCAPPTAPAPRSAPTPASEIRPERKPESGDDPKIVIEFE